jgi:hypothetical protein
MTEEVCLKQVFRSDKLQTLLSLASSISGTSPLLREFVRFTIVLDASSAQEHLRWLLGKRTNPSATTAIHEAIVSGVVIAFAPSYIDREIAEHQHKIAADTHTTSAEVRDQWLIMRESLQLYPLDKIPEEVLQLVDDKDEPYRIVRQQLGARAILTRDAHFKKMGEPAVTERIDVLLRDYARASTVKIGVVIGSGMVFTISVEMVGLLLRTIKVIAQLVRAQSPATQTAIVCGAMLLAIHPKLRSKFLHAWRQCAPAISKGVVELVYPLAVEAAQAAQETTQFLHEIESKLPPPVKRKLIMHARAVSIIAKRPLEAVMEFTRVA